MARSKLVSAETTTPSEAEPWTAVLSWVTADASGCGPADQVAHVIVLLADQFTWSTITDVLYYSPRRSIAGSGDSRPAASTPCWSRSVVAARRWSGGRCSSSSGSRRSRRGTLATAAAAGRARPRRWSCGTCINPWIGWHVDGAGKQAPDCHVRHRRQAVPGRLDELAKRRAGRDPGGQTKRRVVRGSLGAAATSLPPPPHPRDLRQRPLPHDCRQQSGPGLSGQARRPHRLHYLPAYSPQTNPIERVWWHLREQITRNHKCDCIEELETHDCVARRARPIQNRRPNVPTAQAGRHMIHFRYSEELFTHFERFFGSSRIGTPCFPAFLVVLRQGETLGSVWKLMRPRRGVFGPETRRDDEATQALRVVEEDRRSIRPNATSLGSVWKPRSLLIVSIPREGDFKEISTDAPTPTHGRAVVCRPGPSSKTNRHNRPHALRSPSDARRHLVDSLHLW